MVTGVFSAEEKLLQLAWNCKALLHGIYDIQRLTSEASQPKKPWLLDSLMTDNLVKDVLRC